MAYVAGLPLLPVRSHVLPPGTSTPSPSVLSASRGEPAKLAIPCGIFEKNVLRALSLDTGGPCAVWGLSAMLAFFWPARSLLGRVDMSSGGAMGMWGHGVAQILILERIAGNLKRNLNRSDLGVPGTDHQRGLKTTITLSHSKRLKRG